MAGAPEKQRLLQSWRSAEGPERLELLQELLASDVFPDAEVDTYEREAGLYPDMEDPTFLPKLMKKAEFHELMQSSVKEDLESGIDKCKPAVEFELSSVQRFVNRLLSPRTPYQSALLFHGVGVGKTCAAVTVCESFLEQYPGRECFIVAPAVIQEGFKRTIFNSDKETLVIPDDERPNSHRGCTGNLYLDLTDTRMVKNRAMIQSRVTKLINKRYKFFGYTSFANYIEELVKDVDKIEDEEERELQKNIVLRDAFSNRVLIIDEAHNLRDNPFETTEDTADDISAFDRSDSAAGKKLTPLLKDVLRNTVGTTVVLMTATPMYNSYLEIIFLLNLLLLNDKYPELRVDDVFDRESGSLTEDGAVLLGSIASCYVSFMRGENPLTFPIRLAPSGGPGLRLRAALPAVAGGPPDVGIGRPQQYPRTLPNSAEAISNQERVEVSKMPLLAAFLSGPVEAQYRGFVSQRLERGGLGITNLDALVQAGNWMFPGDDDDLSNRIGQAGFDATFEKDYAGTLATYTCNYEPEWLLEENLGQSSPKAKLLLERLRKVRGVSFVYSRFVASGALAIALALEANGYTMAGREVPLFADPVPSTKGRQCALCSRREIGHGQVPAEDGTPAHTFKPARYVLLTGSDELSPNNKTAIDLARNIKNARGEDVKVVIGSQIAGEGLDLRFIREVFVFDSWYHLNKLEQIVGRGIRNCSHSALEQEKRNCTVSLLVNAYSTSREETVDTYSYRMALRKAKQVGEVTRVLKEYALDCSLNHDAIVMSGLGTWDSYHGGRPLLDSQGKPRPGVELDDVSYSPLCDWLEDCDYPCRVPGGEEIERTGGDGEKSYALDESELDKSTYDEYAARNKIGEIKRQIEQMVVAQKQPFFTIDKIYGKFDTIPPEILSSILQEIVIEKEFRVVQGDRRGKIILRNGFLVFQPDGIDDRQIPIAIRLAHVPFERDDYGKYSGTDIDLPPEVELEERDEEGEDAGELWEICKIVAESIEGNVADQEELVPLVMPQVTRLRESAGIEVTQQQRVEMIFWIADMLTTEEQRNIYAAVVLEYFWDEFLPEAFKVGLLTESPNDPDVRSVAADAFWTVKGVHGIRWVKQYKSDEETKAETKKEASDPLRLVQHLVLPDGAATAVAPSIGILEILRRESGKPEFDPLVRSGLKPSTTGFEYGMVNYSSKSNRFLFKINRPPEGKKKVGLGAECSGTSATGIALKRLLALGKILQETKGYDLGFNEVELGRRRIANSVRVCAATNLLLRYMDKVRVKGLRWFYRPLETVLYKHPLR